MVRVKPIPDPTKVSNLLFKNHIFLNLRCYLKILSLAALASAFSMARWPQGRDVHWVLERWILLTVYKKRFEKFGFKFSLDMVRCWLYRCLISLNLNRSFTTSELFFKSHGIVVIWGFELLKSYPSFNFLVCVVLIGKIRTKYCGRFLAFSKSCLGCFYSLQLLLLLHLLLVLVNFAFRRAQNAHKFLKPGT
jgi:hypothetical protein